MEDLKPRNLNLQIDLALLYIMYLGQKAIRFLTFFYPKSQIRKLNTSFLLKEVSKGNFGL